MRLQLVAVGHKMPAWVNAGFAEYQKRLPPHLKLELKEVPTLKRSKSADLNKLIAQEGQRCLDLIPKDHYVIALDESGEQLNTLKLAQKLKHHLQDGQNISILIGSPEGLAPACRQRANATWSLSKLTFPHPLVRVILAEQLYRAWTVLDGHPYHRE